MYKLYKASEDIDIYQYKDGEYIVCPFKKIIKDTLIFLKDIKNGYLKIIGNDCYVPNINLKRAKKEKKNTISVLMYHFFYDKNNIEDKIDHNYIEKKLFYKQMKYLADHHYNTITPDELEKYLDGKEKIPDKTIMITIDDGAISMYKYAFPILKRFNLKASCALITSTITPDNDMAWHFTQKMCDEMLKSDLITFYSHSHNMHYQSEDNIAIFLTQDEKKSKQDLLTSLNFVNNKTLFCYPYGHYNLKTEKILKDVGFRMAVTTEIGKVDENTNKFRIPRIRIGNKTDLKTFIKIINI